MTLDPKSLSSEERAIVEEMVTRDQMFWAQSEFANAFMMNKAEHWQRSYDCAFARILARRAIFGEPASEPASTYAPLEPHLSIQLHRKIQIVGCSTLTS